MKDLLKASIPVIIGAGMGFGISKLLSICFDFIYKHFGETWLYVAGFVGTVVVGTVVNYVVRKYIFDKGKSEDKG